MFAEVYAIQTIEGAWVARFTDPKLKSLGVGYSPNTKSEALADLQRTLNRFRDAWCALTGQEESCPIALKLVDSPPSKYVLMARTLGHAVLQNGRTSGGIQDPTSSDYLLWMCQQIEQNHSWPPDKASRWIGYIQGVMIANGWTTFETESERAKEILEEKPNAPTPAADA